MNTSFAAPISEIALLVCDYAFILVYKIDEHRFFHFFYSLDPLYRPLRLRPLSLSLPSSSDLRLGLPLYLRLWLRFPLLLLTLTSDFRLQLHHDSWLHPGFYWYLFHTYYCLLHSLLMFNSCLPFLIHITFF